MKTLIEQVETYLLANGFSEKITLTEAPPKPDTLLTVYTTGGYAPDLDIPFSNPVVMVHCRSKEYATADALAWKVYNLFNRKEMYTMGEVYVLMSSALQSPIPMNRVDESGRHVVVVNIKFKLQDITP